MALCHWSTGSKMTGQAALPHRNIHNTEDQLGICISDTGIGISKYNLNNIFNRFWRENRIVTDGNGLGLYLCKEIISLHDGYIIVESEKNCGTTTKIFLPFYYNSTFPPVNLA